MSSEKNLAIWTAVETTNPAHTKNFSGRAGGFKGTAMNSTWLAQRATELFGPCGIGWGMTVLDEQYIKGAPLLAPDGITVIGHELVHVVRAKLWYCYEDKRGEIEQFGQTQMVMKRNDGRLFTDEEAPKKSLTDAQSKCLSMLGFGADIFKGYYDDNKYVAELREEFKAEAGNEQGMGEDRPRPEPPPVMERRVPQRNEGPRLSVAAHSKAIREASTVEALKAAFALAWKQNEKPGDPSAKTAAQLRFKGEYDARLAELTAPAQQPAPSEFGEV